MPIQTALPNNMSEDQEDPTNHYTINRHTHYTVQYKDKHCIWVGDVGKIQYYNSIAEAEAAIEETFADEHQHRVEQATIIEWKKTPIAVKLNNKPVVETVTWFDVEVLHEDGPDVEPYWYVRKGEFDTIKEAQYYIRENTRFHLHPDKFRIVQRETTTKSSIREQYVS